MPDIVQKGAKEKACEELAEFRMIMKRGIYTELYQRHMLTASQLNELLNRIRL